MHGAHIIPEALSTLPGSQILTEKLLGENVGRVMAVLEMRFKAHPCGQRAERIEDGPEQQAYHDGAPLPPEYESKGQRQEKQRIYDKQRIQTYPVVAERQKDLRAVRIHAVQKNVMQNEQVGREPCQRQRPAEWRRVVGDFWDAPAVHQPGDEGKEQSEPQTADERMGDPPVVFNVLQRGAGKEDIHIGRSRYQRRPCRKPPAAFSRQGVANDGSAQGMCDRFHSVPYLAKKKGKGFFREKPFPGVSPNGAAYHSVLCRAHVPHPTGK